MSNDVRSETKLSFFFSLSSFFFFYRHAYPFQRSCSVSTFSDICPCCKSYFLGICAALRAYRDVIREIILTLDLWTLIAYQLNLLQSSSLTSTLKLCFFSTIFFFFLRNTCSYIYFNRDRYKLLQNIIYDFFNFDHVI